MYNAYTDSIEYLKPHKVFYIDLFMSLLNHLIIKRKFLFTDILINDMQCAILDHFYPNCEPQFKTKEYSKWWNEATIDYFEVGFGKRVYLKPEYDILESPWR